MANVSEAQTTALMLVPKFTAAASVLGSSCILRHVIHLWRKSSSSSTTSFTTRHRLLAGMSLFDLASSLAWFMTSWPMPQWVPWAKWNYGTTQTCTAQGFFVQWGMGTICYNACLSLYYLLVIRYGVRNQYIALHVEKWMHVSVISFVLGTSITALALELFNPLGWLCWINANPPWCTQSHRGEGPTDCIRGDNARLYAIFFWHLPTWCIMIFCIVCMLLIYLKIRSVEHNVRTSAVRPGRLQRKFAIGAIAYVGAMFLAWSFWTGVYIYFEASGGQRVNWWLSFVAAVLLPTQGFSNALIYFSSMRSRGEETSRVQRIMSCLCCCIDNDDTLEGGSSRPSSGRSHILSGSLWRLSNRTRQSTRQQESKEEAASSDNDGYLGGSLVPAA